jgi:tetratricopeptide (TPR) repeat protein
MTALAVESGFLAQQADLAWQDRAKPGQTEQAIQLWVQAVRAEPGRGELWVHLTKACGRAVRHCVTSAERKRWADRAREYGAQAVQAAPQSSDAYAAYGEALGQWADAHKGVHSLKYVRLAVNSLKKAVELNPKNAYAHMLLASFYRESPGIISVGDKQKALEEAKLAVEYGPQYAIDHLVLARSFLDVGKKEEGIAQLQIMISLTPPEDAVPETHADQETAQAMLKGLGVAVSAIPCGQAGGYCSDQGHP